jgi:hypothetical protein
MVNQFRCCLRLLCYNAGFTEDDERVYGIIFLTRVEDEHPKAKPSNFKSHIKF